MGMVRFLDPGAAFGTLVVIGGVARQTPDIPMVLLATAPGIASLSQASEPARMQGESCGRCPTGHVLAPRGRSDWGSRQVFGVGSVGKVVEQRSRSLPHSKT
jgi:hypothetical protein